MVQRGSPELPGDYGDNLNTNGTHIINYGQNTSDESDDDANVYEGYEPISGDDPMQQHDDEDGEDDDDVQHNTDPHLPNILSSDVEIEQQIWSEPRPEALNLELDSSRTEQIMSAMANIILPNSAIPDWAQGVPEERWKQDLLERIRQRKDASSSGESSSTN